MIRLEPASARCVRVIGSLQEPELSVLREAIAQGATVLDLSEVAWADESAVRLLAELARERCALAACPTWLSLWIDRVRQSDGKRP